MSKSKVQTAYEGDDKRDVILRGVTIIAEFNGVWEPTPLATPADRRRLEAALESLRPTSHTAEKVAAHMNGQMPCVETAIVSHALDVSETTLALLREVANELASATEKFGTFHSAHEGYGVLAEEFAELLDAIRANDNAQIRAEAVQIAAMALQLMHFVDCTLSTGRLSNSAPRS